MTWKQIVHTLAVTMLLFLASCTLVMGTPISGNTSEPTTDPQTQVAQAVAATFAAQTQMALSVQQTLAAVVTDTPQFTYTPQYTYTPLPTYTLQFTYTLQYTYTPQATSTSGTPMVGVSVQTNCRAGPGKVYDVLGIVNVGETAQVLGRYGYNEGIPANDYWIIKLPSNPSITCWLWGMYATVVGNTSFLPIFNAPPTPTPSPTFTVVYTGTISCTTQYAFRFDITNNGSITWQSIRITITDNTTAAVFVHSLDTFRSYNGCILDLDQQDLTPGETGPVSNVNPGQIGYDPAGHSFTAIFRLCSENGLAGTCLEKTLSFNP